MVLHLHSAIISIMNLETHVDGNILLLRIANPPVNSLSWNCASSSIMRSA